MDQTRAITLEMKHRVGGFHSEEVVATALRAAQVKIENLARARRTQDERAETERARAVAEARRQKSVGRKGGKRVTLPEQDVTPQDEQEEVVMAGETGGPGEVGRREEFPAMSPEAFGEGFADRIAREAQEESEKVLRDLAQVKFRADQIVRVLKALDLPVPADLEDLGSVALVRIPAERIAPEPAAEETPPPPPEDPEADPDREDAEEDAAAESAGESRADRKAERLQAVIAAAKRLGTFSTRQLAEAAEIPSGSIYAYVAELKDAGVIIADPPRGFRHKDVEAAETEPAPPPRETPAVASLEDVPEHLRGMPVFMAGDRAPHKLGQAVSAAEKQYAILEAFRSRGKPTTVPEARKVVRIPISDPTFGTHTAALRDAGLLKPTGVVRWAEGQTAGKGGPEYVVAEETAPTPEPEATPDQPDPEAWPKLEEVRNAACRREGPFTPRQIANEMTGGEAASTVITIVHARLTRLAESGIIKDESPGEDMALFEYVPPDGPGRAAEIDARRHREEHASMNGHGSGGAPVPGTGTGVRSGNKETQDLLDRARRAGANISKTGADHYAIENPANGRRVIIYGTPGAPSRDKNKKKLAGIGINV